MWGLGILGWERGLRCGFWCGSVFGMCFLVNNKMIDILIINVINY